MPQRTGFVRLEPELTLLPGAQPWLRLRISDGGRQYVVKSIPDLLENIEHGRSVSYGKALAFVHRWDAFDEESRALLQLLRRQVSARQSLDKAAVRVYGGAEQCRRQHKSTESVKKTIIHNHGVHFSFCIFFSFCFRYMQRRRTASSKAAATSAPRRTQVNTLGLEYRLMGLQLE